MRRPWLLCALIVWSCGEPAEPLSDAGSDAGSEVEVLGCGRGLAFPALRWSQTSFGMTASMQREVYLELERDCLGGAELTLSASEDGVVEIPDSVVIDEDFDRASLTIRALAEGTVTLTAAATHPSGDSVRAEIEVAVIPEALPSCAGEATGMAAPGAPLAVSGGTLGGAAIAIPEGAARDDRYHVDPFDASIECAEDVAPDGYRPLGPAVAFGPGHVRLSREIPIAVPIRLALLPQGAHRGHVEVAYRGPNDDVGRILPIASPRFDGTAGDGTLTFEVPRLGTYQAVVSESAPTRRERTFSFRGILGFSMGGSGAGRIGLGNPERFDLVAPLGGPTDWTFMLEYMRRFHLGGFCDEDQRQADPEGCAMGSSLARVPETGHRHEHAQHFEHWWYEDGHEGQGGTFNRRDYIEIFRDLSTMFGNPNSDRTADPSEPSITPPGVPDSRRALSDAERCAPENQVVIPPFDGAGDRLSGSEGAGFFDDEYNPDGAYPAITFCDGGEVGGDIGRWNPDASHGLPIEVALAVDIDGDGRRGPGEPVIRNGREPFDDFGLDGIPSEAEAGYDPVTNPDPAGDDFDFQYNPTGTEGNWTRDTPDGDPCNPEGEAFLDVGLDGVLGTRQLAAANGLPGGGFDIGEGNGCFDRSRGARRMIDSSPRNLATAMDPATLDDVDLFADGGIRDLFNWVVMGDVTTAGWTALGRPVRFYNGYPALHLDGRPALDWASVPWDEVGRNVMVRYGSVDEEDRFVRAGDGGHVGTTGQFIDRLRAGLAVLDARWPDGDRRRDVDDRICGQNVAEECGYVNSFVMEFTASDGRVGPVSVVLPPGYFAPENADLRYPVVYFLHGYGMSPEDLVALGLLMWEAMNTSRVGSSRRLQKTILVFPDGRCREDECLNGTFYTDAPDNVPGGGQIQSFMLDLMDHMDENYRTRMPETFEVLE